MDVDLYLRAAQKESFSRDLVLAQRNYRRSKLRCRRRTAKSASARRNCWTWRWLGKKRPAMQKWQEFRTEKRVCDRCERSV